MLVDVAQILGDIIYLGSFLVIIISVEKNKSCAGWSGRMQILTMFTFLSRFWMLIDYFPSWYEAGSKMLWIILTAYVLYIIYKKYSDTYEKRCDTFWIESIILFCLSGAFVFVHDVSQPAEIAWLFSFFNESLSILPQCYFVILKRRKDIVVTYYVIMLFYYRLLYIAHWFIGYLNENYFDPFVVYPGIIQFFLYGAYFLLPMGCTDVEEGECPESSAPRNRPIYLTQESLLETPLLKRSATSSSSLFMAGETPTLKRSATASSSIFIVGENTSDTSSLNRSISNPGSDDTGKY